MWVMLADVDGIGAYVAIAVGVIVVSSIAGFLIGTKCGNPTIGALMGAVFGPIGLIVFCLIPTPISWTTLRKIKLDLEEQEVRQRLATGSTLEKLEAIVAARHPDTTFVQSQAEYQDYSRKTGRST